MLQIEFSKRLKELMELEGISKRALSLKIQVDRASIRLWLGGRFFPRYDALIKLATFFKVRVDTLLGIEKGVRIETEWTTVEGKFCENTQKYFFERVTAFMAKKKWTKYAFAKNLSIDAKAFTNWLTIESMPETATIIRLAAMMNVSIDELLGREV